MKTIISKKVHLNQIPAKGLEISISADESWVKEIFENIFTDHAVDDQSIHGKMNLTKYETDVSCNGHIEFTHHPLCARCGNDLTQNEKIDFTAHFTPLFTSSEDRKKHEQDIEEIEVAKEDLDFCFYENDQIILNNILNDEIALHLPYNYYCEDRSSCDLTTQNNSNILPKSDVDPRWAKLKNLKLNK